MSEKEEPKRIFTEDGYTFYRYEDGSYGDHPENPDFADMTWPSYQSMIQSFDEEEIDYAESLEEEDED